MKRILLVEDDPHYRKVMEYILIKEGYEVVGCASGEEAFKQLDNGRFQLVITDYKMGKVSGLDVAAAAATSTPQIPVFMVTAHSDMVFGELSRKDIRRIFNKPISLRILTEAVNSLMDQNAPDNSQVRQHSYSKRGRK